jgi:hypothetical protein
MPNNQALQVFYGTLPLIIVLVTIWVREQLLLKDILNRLGVMDAVVHAIKDELAVIRERLVALETRAGIIYRG